MKTIIIVGGIILAGATVITIVQNDRKKDMAPETHQAGDGHDHPAQPVGVPSAAPSLNPAHGLAGHRCDLPVGAPLTAASGIAAPVKSLSMNQAPQQPASGASSVSQSSAPGVKINPAHGLPGHRCDLQVGAPLTGASGTASPQQTPTINMSPASSQSPSATPSATRVKINPAHGLPGHRCDIQVGAPLT